MLLLAGSEGLAMLALCLLIATGCGAQSKSSISRLYRNGAERTSLYMDMLKGKRVGVVANQTSMVGKVHLVDTLIKSGLNVSFVFAPEHGFRGEAEAGEHVSDGIDKKTGVRVISLYGKSRKPSPEDMKVIDVVVFDIQDVGVRFYTYISTLQYMMEACSERKIPLIVLDRPNPHAGYVDGPVLDTAYRSFVGMQPVPVVYGMTMAEYAGMLNGEKWLSAGLTCDLRVIPCQNWNRSTKVSVPVPPSPNLPNDQAIRLYPSLCFFEGTQVSLGRGTALPFQCYGFPSNPKGYYRFTPVDIKGKAVNPPYEGVECVGEDLSAYRDSGLDTCINLKWLLEAYAGFGDKGFFTDFFDKLAGTSSLREQIRMGWDEQRIRASWFKGLEAFREVRKRYLLYK